MNLELKNICFSYPKKPVLDNLCILFEEAQIHAIVGENGSGKSTMANIICGELKPSSGSIILDNKECIFNSPKDAILHEIAYVHQKPQLAENLTVWENIIYSYKFSKNHKTRKKQKEHIKEIANMFLPNTKLSLLLEKIPSDIRFFISLTSVLINRPKIVVLDEPSSLLDKTQVEFLYKNLEDLKKLKVNIIVITHNKEETKKYADTVVEFKKRDYAQKDPSFLQKDPSVLRRRESQTCFQWSNISCITKNHIPLKKLCFNVKSGELTLIQGRSEDGLSLLENIVTAMNKFSAQGKFCITKDSQLKEIYLSKKMTPYSLQNKAGLVISMVPTNKKTRGSNPLLSINQMILSTKTSLNVQNIIECSDVNIQEEELCKNLSGGMLQRLLINKELAKQPELLILCNPLQGLDSKAEEKLCVLLQKQLQNNLAILILSYNDFPKSICTNIYKLEKGELSPW